MSQIIAVVNPIFLLLNSAINNILSAEQPAVIVIKKDRREQFAINYRHWKQSRNNN